MGSLGIPFSLPPLSEEEEEGEAAAAAGLRSDESVKDDSGTSTSSAEPATSVAVAASNAGGAAASPDAKSTRTRTVKSRTVFTPEDDREKKPRGRNGGRPPGTGGAAGAGRGRGRGRGRPPKNGQARSALQDLLEDEEIDGGGGGSDAHRKRSRNASDGENRWDRIRATFKVLLQKMRMDAHFLQVYQQDGWRSSGREKLKPTAELQKAEDRVRGIKAELRQVTKRLTEMNSGGFRWGALQEDGEGNIEVDEIMCTKCGRGDSDDHDDILLCDYAGCFRAYHQNCLSPPIKPDAFPGEEEDWFCWQCECLTDCLDLLEREFQGTKFTSWQDVFPDVEARGGSEGVAAEPTGGLLETDSDDSDDESFKESSSSESEDEKNAADRRRAGGANSGGGSGSGGGSSGGSVATGDSSSGGGGSSSSDGSDGGSSSDSDAGWMSDAESVGSDEVSKLCREAGDLASFDEADDGGGGGSGGGEEASLAYGSRSSRARARRAKRNAALGLGDDRAALRQREKREIVEALAGNPVDPSNIIESRTRRKNSVDYVKLNQTVFGEGAVDGDQLSSDEEDESSEASEGEASEGEEASGASPPAPGTEQEHASADASEGEEAGGAAHAPSPRTKRAPKKWSPPDPFATKPRKRGRPKKSTIPPPGEKRKRGRPRKIVADGAAAGGNKPKKRRVGRPTKAESEARKRDSGSAGAGSSLPAPQGAAQIAPNGRYQTKNGKGPGRRPAEVFLMESDTDEEDEVVSSTDVPVVGRLPAFTLEDMEDDTAEVAAVAAAVAARAAQDAAP